MKQFYTLEEVKAYAKKLLEETDYSVLPDVNLSNKNEFINFRILIRNVYFNPSLSFQFPDNPSPIWSKNSQIINEQPNTDLPTE